MSDQNLPPLKQIEGEPREAFDAFVIYAEMGTKRSIDKAYIKSLKLKGEGQIKVGEDINHHWFRWSSKYNWQDRVREYDDWDFMLRQEENLSTRKLMVKEIGDRLIKDLGRDLDLSEGLMGRLEQFLQEDKITPLVFKTFCNAHKDIVFTRKAIYESYLGLSGINAVSEELMRRDSNTNNAINLG